MNSYRYEIQTNRKSHTVLFRTDSYGEAFGVADHLSMMYRSIRIVEINTVDRSVLRVKAVWNEGRLKSYDS